MRNQEKDALEMAAKRERILKCGFRIFSERTIEKVSMKDVADAADVGIATLYRYYKTKQELVLAIGTMMWDSFARSYTDEYRRREKTAAEEFDRFLESFLELYRNRKDILRFNQFFNVFVASEKIPPEQLEPYGRVIETLAARFHEMYVKGEQDGTMRTDIPEQEIFSGSMHLMLAAVTRYAVGLVYAPPTGHDPEKELVTLKQLILEEYTKNTTKKQQEKGEKQQ